MSIRKLAYELYVIDWERRISAERKMDALKNWYQETAPEDREEYPFEDYLDEVGYDGELYVCFDEFVDEEYCDEEYMRTLLDNEALYEEYEDDLESLLADEDDYDEDDYDDYDEEDEE